MKKYTIVAPTSMGVRITPIDRQPVDMGGMFRMQATSAESNVLSISAGLGLPVKALTAFVEGSPVSRLIQRDLHRRGIDYEGKEVRQGGPWGYRHQFNIADAGYGLRAPRVTNDRAGEVGRTLSAADFDSERIFGEEGAEFLHLSGLIAALSPGTGQLCLALARAAAKYGTRISFDLNYRASFWEGREEELSALFREIASLSDILVGNEEDFQLCLGVEGPETGGKEVKTERFRAMVERVRVEYPHAKTFATTLREVRSANEHLWGAIVLSEGEWTVIEPRPIPVLDRIGGGDGFVGGLLYAMSKGYAPAQCAQFGWACGAFVATLEDDFGLPADEKQIWDIWAGNARVQR